MNAAGIARQGPHELALPAARYAALLAAPLLVLITEYLLYQGLSGLLGPRLGYLLAFGVYWFGWCWLFPVWVLGADQLRQAFGPARPRFGRPAWLGLTFLGLPLLLAYGTALPLALPHATLLIVAASALIALINGVSEEVLWRGVYLRAFPGRVWLGAVWPSIGFAIWHFAPQSVRVNTMPGGAWSLVLVAFAVGLMWAWVAHRSGSIRWTALAHVLFNLAGLGATVYIGRSALPL